MINRIIYLGQEVEASAYFLDKDRKPLQPKDIANYPKFSVIDSAQDLICSGVGTLNQNTLAYNCVFTIPDMALISTDLQPYRIEWELEDINNKSWNIVETFEVVHPSYDITSAKEQQKLVLPSTSLPLSLPVPKGIDSIEVSIYNASSALVYNSIPTNVGLYNQYYVYGTTVPPNVFQSNNEYMIVWTLVDEGQVYSHTQVLHCTSIWEMKRISDLRMYLDKVAKDVDLYTGYKDSDMYFYLIMGNQYLNSIAIPTNWNLLTWQQSYNMKESYYWLLEASKWVGLRAQFLAEGDSAFDFSGQPVSLTVDRTQYIESELGRIKDDLDNKAVAWKNAMVKNTTPVGHLNLSCPTVPTKFGVFDFRMDGVPLITHPRAGGFFK